MLRLYVIQNYITYKCEILLIDIFMYYRNLCIYENNAYNT